MRKTGALTDGVSAARAGAEARQRAYPGVSSGPKRTPATVAGRGRSLAGRCRQERVDERRQRDRVVGDRAGTGRGLQHVAEDGSGVDGVRCPRRVSTQNASSTAPQASVGARAYVLMTGTGR
jgi:hypothetical protein